MTVEWLRAQDSTDEFGALVLRPLDVSGANTLAECLAAAGLMGWRDAIIAAASPGQARHLDARLSWLMGQAAIAIAVSMDQPENFGIVETLQMLGNVSNATLASIVCSRVADVHDSYPLLALLRTHLQALWNSHFNVRMRRYAEAIATRPLTSRDLWPRYDGMPIGVGWAHQVAAALWPGRYMEMLASFPTLFQHGFGDPLSPIDLDLAASLVSASPNVFSIDGAPLGPVVIFALFDAIETRFTATDMQDMAAVETGLGHVLDNMFSRSDGNWIGRAWLQQIIWRDTPRRAGRAQADVNAQRSLRDRLRIQLSSRITPLGEAAFDWIRQEEPLWGVHRVLSEASILAAQGNAIAAAEILAEAVRQGLVSATGRPAGLATNSPEATIVALVLSNLSDMKLWFETLWRDTYELREQLSYDAHRNLDNPAYPALAWSLIGLNASGAASVDTAGVWRVIAGAVFETQRIDPNANLFNGAMPSIIRVAVQLGAVLTEGGILPISDFASFLSDQLEPTVEHAHLWQIARSGASDSTTLAVGRLVGATRLRQALEAGFAQHRPAWGVALDRAAQDDLVNFSSRL